MSHTRLVDEQGSVGLLAEQLRDVAVTANTKRLDGRISDLKRWRQVLAQFIPIVLRECRANADVGNYQCEISLAELLKASQYRSAFPETKVFCWHCQAQKAWRGDTEQAASSILRGCYFSTQPDDVVEAPAKLEYDVTDFINAVAPVITTEMRMHGFNVQSITQTFNLACTHLRLFTPGVEAPGVLLISWGGAEAPQSQADQAPPPPSTTTGNLIMSCGICHEDKPMQTIVPCGHLICNGCWAAAGGAGGSAGAQCPFCRSQVFNVNPLFVP